MPDPFTNRLTLTCLHLAALGRGFLRLRDGRRKAAFRNRAAFYEQAWRAAAEQLGGTFAHVGGDIAEIAVGDRKTRVSQNVCAIDDPVTLELLGDKPLTYRILAAEGLPTPRHAVFTLRSASTTAATFLRASRTPCVVKPAAGTGGGRGVSTGIRTRGQLARAAAAAAAYCGDVLIEEQVPGDNYRLLYLDGELVDAFVRRAPSAVGDGRSTVAALVRAGNDERLRHGAGRSQALLAVDLDMRRTLAGQGLTLRSVPAAGAVVTLKTVVNDNCGADNEGAAGLLCDAVVDAGARAVRALGVRLGGVDLITPDPARPLGDAGGTIIEVNGSPNFYYHYHKRDGAFPVAVHVLRALLAGPGPASPLPAEADLAYQH